VARIGLARAIQSVEDQPSDRCGDEHSDPDEDAGRLDLRQEADRGEDERAGPEVHERPGEGRGHGAMKIDGRAASGSSP
jgi:hypothetical protein